MTTNKKDAPCGDPGKTFNELHEKIRKFGITPEQLAKLESVKTLKNAKRNKLVRNLKWGVCLCVTVFSVLVGCVFAGWPVSREKLASWYFELRDLDMDKATCMVEYSEILLDFARPPVDCSFCKGVNEEHRVTKLSPEEFEEKYAYSGQLVVILDAMQNWTAPKVFDFDFFKGIYSEDSPALNGFAENCQFFPYQTEFDKLGEVFNMSEDRATMKADFKPWYIGWSNCDSSAANILRKHYTRPYFLPTAAESSKTDWIFMGVPGYGAHMHIDNVGLPSWQAQITGTKVWTIEPPPECYHECGSGFFKVTVAPGQIIVLDTNKWYHGTLITGDDMSITIGSEYD